MTEDNYPALSPSFERARRLSRLLARLFAIGFWLTLFYMAVVAFLMVVPLAREIGWDDAALVPLASGHSLGERLLGAFSLSVGVLPGLFLLTHAWRLFRCFADGKVFAAEPVAHIRAIGLWLIVSAGATFLAKIGLAAANGNHVDASLKLETIIYGIATFVAAHVMAEARRIADENAGFV